MKKLVILAMVIGLVATVAKYFLGDEDMRAAVTAKIQRVGDSDPGMPAT